MIHQPSIILPQLRKSRARYHAPLAGLLLAGWLTALQAAEPPATYPELTGLGLSDPNAAFVDLFPCDGRIFTTLPDHPDGSRNLLPGTEMNEQGWPLVKDFHKVIADLRFTGSWWDSNPAANRDQGQYSDDPEKFQTDVSGVYKMSFHGQAVIEPSEIHSVIGLANQVYDADTNTTTLDLILPPYPVPNEPGQPWYNPKIDADSPDFDPAELAKIALDQNGRPILNSGLINLNFREALNPDSPTGFGVTDIKVIKPGYHDRPDQLLTDQFVKLIAPFPVLRFMDFKSTNNTSSSTERLWTQRRRPTQAQQFGDFGHPAFQPKEGMCWEYVIAIANAADAHPWINLKVDAGEDYIRKLAVLFKTGVDLGGLDPATLPNLPELTAEELIAAGGTRACEPLHSHLAVYLEHDNEVWNPGFGQHADNWAFATSELEDDPDSILNLPSTSDGSIHSRRRHLLRVIRMGQIWGEVFGVSGPRATLMQKIRPVYAHWTAQSGQWKPILDWGLQHFNPLSNYIHSISITPYWSLKGGKSVDEVLANAENSIRNNIGTVRSFKALADSYGVLLTGYEGGPNAGQNTFANAPLAILAARHPRNLDLIHQAYREAWFDLGADVFNQFTSGPGRYSRFGTWGMVEGFDRLYSYKHRAILDVLGYDYSTDLGPPATPAELAVTPTGARGLRLTWTDPNYNEDGYVIYSAPDMDSAYTERARLPANATSFAEILPPDTTRYYLVKAFHPGGMSEAPPPVHGRSALANVVWDLALLPENSVDGLLENWLGWLYYWDSLHPWAYSFRHGWIYTVGDNEDSFWMYNSGLDFAYTGKNIHPFLYSTAFNAWLYDLGNETGPRQFWRTDTGETIEIP